MKIAIETDVICPNDTFYSIVSREILGDFHYSGGSAGSITKQIDIDDRTLDVWVVVDVPREGGIRIINFAAVVFNRKEKSIRRLCVEVTRFEKEVNKQLHEKEVSRN